MRNTFTTYHIRDLDQVALGKHKHEMARCTSIAQHRTRKRGSGRVGIKDRRKKREEKRQVEETNTTGKIIPVWKLKAI